MTFNELFVARKAMEIKMKKVLSVFMSLVTVFTMCFAYTGAVFAEDIPLGDGIKGTFDAESATLTVSYEGEDSGVIPDYTTAPVFDNIENVKTIKVEASVQEIGTYVFYNCTNLEKIMVYDSLCEIKENALPDNENIVIYGQTLSRALVFAAKYGYQSAKLYNVTYVSYTGSSLSNELYPEGTPLSDIQDPEFTSGYTQPLRLSSDGTYKHKSSMNIWSPNPVPSGDTLTNAIIYTELSVSEECTFKDTVVNATCTEEGYTLHECTKCEFSYIDNETDMIPHDFGTDGNEKNCAVCGAENPNFVQPSTDPTDPAPTDPAPTEPAVTVPTITEPVPTAPAVSVSETTAAQAAVPSASTSGASAVPESTTEYQKQPTSVIATEKKTVTPAKPKKTSIKKLTKGKKQFKITWKKISGVTGYQVQYSTSSKFTKSKTKTVTVQGAKKVSKTIKKLKSGKKYYVRVRTYKKTKVNGKVVTTFSAYTKAKSVKVK